MAIFKPSTLKVDNEDYDINKIVNHVNLLQEQLAWVLSHIDSDNVTEIDGNITSIINNS